MTTANRRRPLSSSPYTSTLPSVPTAVESGLANVQAYTWTAVYLPKNVPAAVVQRLHKATVDTMDSPAVREKLARLGATIVAPDRRSPAYLASFTRSELDKWKGPVAASGAISD